MKVPAEVSEATDVFGPAPRDGNRFRNLIDHPPHGSWSALYWFATRRPPRWPRVVAATIAPKPVERVTGNTIRATLIGHATVLLQVAGLNLLTDPIWSQRASPLSWLGPKRVRPPAIRFDDLPPIDAVLLSHSHYDHLDRPTLAALHRRDRPLVLTGLKVGRLVPAKPVVELDWWQRHALSDSIAATYVPAQHFSARSPFDRNKTLWGGFVLETPAGAVYFAGDTGAGPHIATIGERFGPMTLSLLPIGAYLPRWFMAPVHMKSGRGTRCERGPEVPHHTAHSLRYDSFGRRRLRRGAAALEKRYRHTMRRRPFGRLPDSGIRPSDRCWRLDRRWMYKPLGAQPHGAGAEGRLCRFLHAAKDVTADNRDDDGGRAGNNECFHCFGSSPRSIA